MKLRGIDLNLLPVFEAIYVERGLTRAAQTLNVTQPAVSNALARLRAHFDDPLFVRAGRGVKPTSAAEALIGPIREALDALRAGLELKSRFDPATSTRTFNLSARDLGAFVLAPVLAKSLDADAPGVRLHWSQVDRAATSADLASGRLDLAIDIDGLRGDALESAPLLRQRHVCILRRDHPLANETLSLERFLELRQVTVSSRRGGRGIVEDALRRLGHSMTPRARLPHYMPALQVVMAGDAALCAPEAIARAGDVCVKELPFETPDLALSLYWRAEAGEDAGLRWLRERVLAAAGATT